MNTSTSPITLTDRAIAKDLQISYWTVRTHLDHIFEKLEITNRAALVARLHRGRSTNL